VTTSAAPRIDERLRRFIVGSAGSATPAEVTRATGELAWTLGVPRPGYQQVRVILRASETPKAERPPVPRLALDAVAKTFEFLAQYPGPGLEDWYMRWKRGEV
jgi:hypothetical protein